jgi:hypothetical protein
MQRVLEFGKSVITSCKSIPTQSEQLASIVNDRISYENDGILNKQDLLFILIKLNQQYNNIVTSNYTKTHIINLIKDIIYISYNLNTQNDGILNKQDLLFILINLNQQYNNIVTSNYTKSDIIKIIKNIIYVQPMQRVYNNISPSEPISDTTIICELSSQMANTLLDKSAPKLIKATKPNPKLIKATKPAPKLIKATKPAPKLIKATKPAPKLIKATKPAPKLIKATKPAPKLIKAARKTSTELVLI